MGIKFAQNVLNSYKSLINSIYVRYVDNKIGIKYLNTKMEMIKNGLIVLKV